MRKNDSSNKLISQKTHKVWTRVEWMRHLEKSHEAIMRAGEALLNLKAIYNDKTPKNRKKIK